MESDNAVEITSNVHMINQSDEQETQEADINQTLLTQKNNQDPQFEFK